MVVSRSQALNGLFAALSRQGIEVASLRNKQNRLEQLFMDTVDRDRQSRRAAP